MRIKSRTGVRKGWLAIVAIAAGLALMWPAEFHAQVVAPIIPTPVPTPQRTATPLPTPQTFSCSCSSPGQPVVWAGRLSASNFFFARQAAQGRCLSVVNARTTSPFIQPPSSSFQAVVPQPPGLLPNPCSACACN